MRQNSILYSTLHMNVLPFLMDVKNKKKAGNRGDKEHVLSE